MLEKIQREIRFFFDNENGCHDWDHTQRVLNLAMEIAKKEKADIEIIQYACILHDIGRKKEIETKGKICHAQNWAILAKKILEKHWMEWNKIEKIFHCIQTHRYRDKNNKPESKEAKILFDADKIDSIWATWIGRAFMFAGEIGSKLHNEKNIDWKKTKAYTNEDTAKREFVVKLAKIKDNLYTQTWKKIAKKRHDFMVNFFKQLDEEIYWS